MKALTPSPSPSEERGVNIERRADIIPLLLSKEKGLGDEGVLYATISPSQSAFSW
jgi:hypothetical protein